MKRNCKISFLRLLLRELRCLSLNRARLPAANGVQYGMFVRPNLAFEPEKHATHTVTAIEDIKRTHVKFFSYI